MLCFVVIHTIVVVVVVEDEPDRVRLLTLSPLCVYRWVVKLKQNGSNIAACMIIFLPHAVRHGSTR